MTEHPTLFASPELAEAIAPGRQIVVRDGPKDDEPDDEFPGDENNWRDDPSIVCTEQPAIKVYCNPFGQAVIRQERQWDEEADQLVFIGGEYALAVCGAILNAVGMGDIEFVRPCRGGHEDVDIPPPLGPRLPPQKGRSNGK